MDLCVLWVFVSTYLQQGDSLLVHLSMRFCGTIKHKLNIPLPQFKKNPNHKEVTLHSLPPKIFTLPETSNLKF